MDKIIDINVSQTIKSVSFDVTSNLITINVNKVSGGLPSVSSVNGRVGDVTGLAEKIYTDEQDSLRVPYTGATQDLNLGEFGLQTGNIEFDLTPTNSPTTVGSLVWNDLAGTLDLKLKGGAVTLQIGQETVARIINKTATNITLLEANYQAVRVTGAQGQRPKVDLAQANNDLNSTTTLGLVTETILNNAEGFITTSGQVQQINTTGSLQGETWADGDVLYLSGTVAGRITNIKPIAPIHTVIIGFVEYAHAVNGKIFVKVDNGYELEELHNVSAIEPNNNEALVYDTATSLWKPKTILEALGYAPQRTIIKDASEYTSTGTVVNTIISSYLIPANTFSASDCLKLNSLMITHVGTGTWTVRVYINSSLSLTGATQLAISPANLATALFANISRTFYLFGGNIKGLASSVASYLDYQQSTIAMSINPYLVTYEKYIIITVIPTVSSDTFTQHGINITN